MVTEDELPPIGAYFCNKDETEYLKIVSADTLYIWVDVLDLINKHFFYSRPYSSLIFIKEMVPLSKEDADIRISMFIARNTLELFNAF